MARLTLRAALGAGAVAGIGYALREILRLPVVGIRLTDGGMTGASPGDMGPYMDMFNRHTEITRAVENIAGACAPQPSQPRPSSPRTCTRTCRACIHM